MASTTDPTVVSRPSCICGCGRPAALRRGELAYKGWASKCYLEDVARRKAEKAGIAPPAPKPTRKSKPVRVEGEAEPVDRSIAFAKALSAGMPEVRLFLQQEGTVSRPRPRFDGDPLSLGIARCRSGYCMTGQCGQCEKTYPRDPDAKLWLRCPCVCHNWPAPPAGSE
jgi:hypothetical protein